MTSWTPSFTIETETETETENKLLHEVSVCFCNIPEKFRKFNDKQDYVYYYNNSINNIFCNPKKCANA